jgi:molecular chaperone DnaK (HSP70)
MMAPKRAKETGSSAERETPLRVIGIDLGTTNSTIAEARWKPAGAVEGQVQAGPDDSRLHRRG